MDLRFWTRGGPELIQIRRQTFGLLNKGTVQERLNQNVLMASFCGFDVVEGDVRTVGGKEATWLVWKVKKDDGSEQREQCVEVEIPRKDDTVYISLSAPEEEFDALLATFEAMLERSWRALRGRVFRDRSCTTTEGTSVGKTLQFYLSRLHHFNGAAYILHAGAAYELWKRGRT